MIRGDEIDILVDLTGHVGGNRLLVFARKPAPVQVTYLGYQNTTGMTAIDYRLTDEYCDPSSATEALYSEKLVRLPQTFFCYLPSAEAPTIAPLPAQNAGYVTFGSFNNFTKITAHVLKTWAGILARVDASRLLLLCDDPEAVREVVAYALESQGVDPRRVELFARAPLDEYLKRIGQVDIALDPFPFNGHTTTCDCLWQGVPVVTLAGQAYVSRFGSSGLATLGLTELIAHSPDEYIEIAVGLAGNLDRLAQLRASLRARLVGSPLMDYKGFTRNLEAAYRRMWDVWLDRQD